MNLRDSDDIWRLYRREWVIVHTVTVSTCEDTASCYKEARAWAQENLVGRVHDTDIRYEVNTAGSSQVWCHVKVFKDNLKGEFKHRSEADMYALVRKYDEYTIVPRNSPADHTIRNYGVTKL